MARRAQPSIREVAPEEQYGPQEPLDLKDPTKIPGATNVEIDAASGQVLIRNPDGSADIGTTQARAARGEKTFDDNLAEDLDETTLAGISHDLLEGIEADIQSRRDWEETAAKGAELLGVKLEEASSDVSTEGTVAKIKHTGLLGAVLRSWANARAELLPAGGPVKVRDDNVPAPPDQVGDNQPSNVVPMPGMPVPPRKPTRSELADALEHDWNHYLTVVDKPYYADFSRMLLSRALLGCQFRKVYRDPLKKRPMSRWVKGTDLIVSNDASELMDAARVTERMMMRPSTVKRLQKAGHWRDVALVQPTQMASVMGKAVAEAEGVKSTPQRPEDQLHEVFECYCELDDASLAEDEKGNKPGYPLPYRVTIDKDSRVILEIRRNWKRGDEEFSPRRRYVKYGFVPGLGFYDWGFVHLIGNPQKAATATERLLIDAGMYKSMPGGVIAKGPGTRGRKNEIRPGLGQFEVIDTGGLPIDQVVKSWDYPEPSAVLVALLQDISGQMKEIAGTMEVPVGEGRVGDVPVGTMMAYVDAISKVPSAIHKDDHSAQAEEFELMRELFIEDPAALSKFARKPKRQWAAASEMEDIDLVPCADPNTPSQVHRVMQVTAQVQMAQLPMFQGIADPRALWERANRVLGESDVSTITLPPQPAQQAPPDPKLLLGAAKIAAEKEETQGKLTAAADASHTKLQTAQIVSADKAADRASEERREEMRAATEAGKQHTDLTKHGIDIAHQAQQGAADRTADHVQHLTGLVADHVQHTNEMADSAADREQSAQQSTGAGIVPPAGGGES